MATIYNTPDELPWEEPDYKTYDYRNEQQREAEYTAKLAAWCRERNKGDLVGKIIRHRVADGFAQYMIECHRPFQLIHLPFGDRYSAGKVWERGCRLADARELVQRDEGLSKLFNLHGKD